MIKIENIGISKLYIGATECMRAYQGNDLVYEKYGNEQFITFTSNADGSTIGLSNISSGQTTLEYTKTPYDTASWSPMTTSMSPIIIDNGEKLYVRGKLNADNTNSNYTQFKMSGKIAAIGNINSLWNYEDLKTPLKQYCGYRLFYDCTGLIDASGLTLGASDMALANNCYRQMFQNCSALTTAPELPATTLAYYCYWSMFQNCTSLTAAPELPATILTHSCYISMFSNCSSLATAPELRATDISDNCYQSMFYNCTGLTTCPSILPATTLSMRCYTSMFQNCSALTTAPELPAPTLPAYCYTNMFQGCRNLNYIKCLAVNGVNQNNSTTNWVYGVSSTGTFVKDPNATWPTGTNGIPEGWNV